MIGRCRGPAILAGTLSLTGAAFAQPYQPPAASAQVLARFDLGAARPIDEDFRQQFARCDKEDKFRNHQLKGWRRCTTDPNNVRTLLALKNGAVLFESKLGLDLDGSWKAWNAKGKADQRGTWLQWARTCRAKERDGKGLCQREQVDAEHVPYVVIPIAGPPDVRQEFRSKTAIGKGDFGVAVYGARWVPVFVADGGPYNKLGEASAATLAALGEDRCTHHNAQGFCDQYRDHSIPSQVVTIIVPGSANSAMTAVSAKRMACDFASSKFGMVGSDYCKK